MLFSRHTRISEEKILREFWLWLKLTINIIFGFVIVNELLGEEECLLTWFAQWVRRILRYRPPPGRQAQNDIPGRVLAFWTSNFTFGIVILNELLGEEESQPRRLGFE